MRANSDLINDSIRIEDISILDAWRLFIDGIRQNIDSGWIGFETREPGYLLAMCQCMKYALENIQVELNAEFVQKLHQLAMSDVKNTRYKEVVEQPGEIRRSDVAYKLDQYVTTKKGLKEIFDEMGRSPHLGLMFPNISQEMKKETDSMMPLIKQSKEQKVHYADILYEYIKKNEIRIFGSFSAHDGYSVDALIKQQFIELINHYQSSIKEAKEDSDKIRPILTFIKDCEHIHIFADGNGRVFYMVLLYFLFTQNHLSLPLMADINRISGYSSIELLAEISKGWHNKNILNETHSLFRVSTEDLLINVANSSEREYFVLCLKLLQPFFKPSVIFNFMDAFIAKNAEKVDAMVTDDESVLDFSRQIFFKHCELGETNRLAQFQHDFPRLFDKLNHDNNKDKRSGFLLAGSNGFLSTAKFLLQQGADPAIKDRWNMNLQGNMEETLKNYMAKSNYQEIARILHEFTECTSSLLSLDKDLGVRIIGESFNHWLDEQLDPTAMFSSDDFDMTKYVLEKLTKLHKDLPLFFTQLINLPDAAGYTPLMIAARYQCKDIFALLIEAKADTTKINKNGEAALDIVKRYDNKECLKLIIPCEESKKVSIPLVKNSLFTPSVTLNKVDIILEESEVATNVVK